MIFLMTNPSVKFLVFILSTAFSLLLLNGCSIRSSLVIWAARPIISGSMLSIMSETDIELAQTALEADLKLLEGILRSRPIDQDLLIIAAQGFTGYSMMFVQDIDPQRARALYDRAMKYGLKALEQSVKGFIRDDLTLKEFSRLVDRLKSDDVPAAYWTAAAWASRINLELTSAKSLSESPRATCLMQWVLDREPDFYFSGPRWFFGTYYSSIPPMLGGNPEKAKKYFDEAVSEDGDHFLWGKALYARHYAVQVLDRELFINLLEEVRKGSKDEPEELRLLNRIAVIKAMELLEQTDELF